MIAQICNADIGNWDEDHWWNQGAADAGDFGVDVRMRLAEDVCENEGCAGEASCPWLVFNCEEDEKIDFQKISGTTPLGTG